MSYLENSRSKTQPQVFNIILLTCYGGWGLGWESDCAMPRSHYVYTLCSREWGGQRRKGMNTASWEAFRECQARSQGGWGVWYSGLYPFHILAPWLSFQITPLGRHLPRVSTRLLEQKFHKGDLNNRNESLTVGEIGKASITVFGRFSV